jgi:hypothetical protein
VPNFKSGQRGVSAKLNDGRTLWFFNEANIFDANIAGYMNCAPTVRNCAIVESGGALSLLNSAPTDFIAVAGLPSMHVQSAYQFLDTIFCLCKPASNVVGGPIYVAKVQYPSLTFIGIDTVKMRDSIRYGYASATNQVLGFVYSYGSKQPSAGKNKVYLARYSLLSPHGQWYYYSAGTWSTFDTAATAIATIDGESFCVVQYKDDYALIAQKASDQCNQGLDITAFYGINEYGQWQNPRKMYTVNMPFQLAQPRVRDVQMHVSDINSSGEVLCSYTVDGYLPCAQSCNNGIMPQAHRSTMFFRLPFEHIYASW